MYIAVIKSEFGDDVLVSIDFDRLVENCCFALSNYHGSVVHNLNDIREAEHKSYLSVDFYEFSGEWAGGIATRLDI